MNLSCLFCGNPIPVHQRLKVDHQLTCPQCKTVFRLVSKSPYQIDWLLINDGEGKVPQQGEEQLDEFV